MIVIINNRLVTMLTPAITLLMIFYLGCSYGAGMESSGGNINTPSLYKVNYDSVKTNTSTDVNPDSSKAFVKTRPPRDTAKTKDEYDRTSYEKDDSWKTVLAVVVVAGLIAFLWIANGQRNSRP